MGAVQRWARRGAALILIKLLSLLIIAPLTNANPPPLSPRKVALLHMYDQAPFFHQLGSITYGNKRRYAEKHGYEFAAHTPMGNEGIWKKKAEENVPCSKGTERNGGCFEEDDSFAIDKRAPTFGKIKLAIASCESREGYWLLWSDADAMIVNQTVPLESVIDDAVDLIVSVDWLMINAGVMLFKCSPWTLGFLQRVYAAREFDEAQALDQSAFQHFFDTEKGAAEHIKYIPKHAINVYAEEYRAGDFILHMAGKLYEATVPGAVAIATQFDVLSQVDDVEDVGAFFRSQYVLNYYSGVCNSTEGKDSECRPDDSRRVRLREPLGYMAWPKRYRHVALRYYWIQDWADKFDVEGWNDGRAVFDPSGIMGSGGAGGDGARTAGHQQQVTHDEL